MGLSRFPFSVIFYNPNDSGGSESFDLAVSGRGGEGGASSGLACLLELGLWQMGSRRVACGEGKPCC